MGKFLAPLHGTGQAKRWQSGSPHLPDDAFPPPLLLEGVAAKQQHHGGNNLLTCLPTGTTGTAQSEEDEAGLCHGMDSKGPKSRGPPG